MKQQYPPSDAGQVFPEGAPQPFGGGVGMRPLSRASSDGTTSFGCRPASRGGGSRSGSRGGSRPVSRGQNPGCDVGSRPLSGFSTAAPSSGSTFDRPLSVPPSGRPLSGVSSWSESLERPVSTPDLHLQPLATPEGKPTRGATTSWGGGLCGESPKVSRTFPLKAKKKQNLERFLERQRTPQCDQRRITALMQRDLIERAREDTEVAFWGAKGVTGFRKMLIARYGSIPAAWRIILDRSGNNKISFGELCHICRDLGYGGNIKKLWKELDLDMDGFIELDELDAEAAAGLAEFRRVALEHYGSILECWREHFDIGRPPLSRVTEEEFGTRCKTLGYSGDPRKLFRWMRVDMSKKYLMLSDFDPQTAWAVFRGDPCAESIGSGNRSSPSKSPAPLTVSMRAHSASSWSLGASRQSFASASRSVSRDLMQSFRDTTMEEEDPIFEEDEGVAAELEAAVEAENNNVAADALPIARPRTRVSTLSPSGEHSDENVSAAPIPGFRRSSQAATWKKKPKKEPPSLMSSGEWSPDDSTGKSQNRRVTCGGSIDELSFWGQNGPMSPGGNSTATMKLTKGSSFMSSGEWSPLNSTVGRKSIGAGVTTPTRSSIWSASLSQFHRDGLDMFNSTLVEKDMGATTMEDLTKSLRLRYGTLYNAWREALDVNSKGKLSFTDFCKVLREQGYKGDFRSLFTELAAIDSEFIVLRDFDPEACDLLSNFRKRLKKKCGNMLNAWNTLYDPKKRGLVDKESFIKVCTKVQIDGGAKIFDMLRTERARANLLLREFDTAAFDAHARGDMNMASDPKHVKETASAPLALSFNERQDGNFAQSWSKVMGHEKRSSVANISAVHKKLDVGMHNFESLKQLLIKKYGTLAIAWRKGLDPETNGRLSFDKLCDATRKLGFSGQMRALWDEIISQGSDHVTLRNFDAEASEALAAFRALLLRKYGNLIAAWRGGLDPKKAGRIEEPDFCQRCEAMGYPGDTKRLYKYVQGEIGRTFITLADVDPLAAQALYRGDHTMLSTQSKQERRAESRSLSPKANNQRDHQDSVLSPSAKMTSKVNLVRRPTMGALWSTELGQRHRQNLESLGAEEIERRMGIADLAGLKKMLLDRFGTSVAAWRTMDRDGNGRLSFGEFCNSLRRISYHGNVKGLWQELDSNGNGHISLHELDPEADAAIVFFRQLLLSKFSCLTEAWYSGLDEENLMRVGQEPFLARCHELGFSAKAEPARLKKIFNWLLPAHTEGRKHLHVEDLEVLLIGIPKHKLKETWSGLEKPPVLPPKAFVNFDELRQHVKHLLVRHYGGVYAGWFRGIDHSHLGRVPLGEFVSVVSNIGFVGNVRDLFKAFDKNNDEQITLSEVDAEVAEATDTFLRLIDDRYGSIGLAWEQGLDKNGNRRCSEDEFLQGCRIIGYPYDAKKLFRFFQPEKGRTFLFLEDLGPGGLAASRNNMRKPRAEARNGSPNGTLRLNSSQTVREQAVSPERPFSRGGDGVGVAGPLVVARELDFAAAADTQASCHNGGDTIGSNRPVSRGEGNRSATGDSISTLRTTTSDHGGFGGAGDSSGASGNHSFHLNEEGFDGSCGGGLGGLAEGPAEAEEGLSPKALEPPVIPPVFEDELATAPPGDGDGDANAANAS